MSGVLYTGAGAVAGSLAVALLVGGGWLARWFGIGVALWGAPLAGIGNWFVRLQAKRYGAGLAVSEMVSSLGIHYGNEKTCTELLRVHPDEHTAGVGGPVSLQLFGQDPDVMRSAAATVAARGREQAELVSARPGHSEHQTGLAIDMVASRR